MSAESDDYQFSLEGLMATQLRLNRGKPISEAQRKEIYEWREKYITTKTDYENAVSRAQEKSEKEWREKAEARLAALHRERAFVLDPESSFSKGSKCLSMGTPEEAVNARMWFKMGAEEGYASAQYELALMLEQGVGGPIDMLEAADLYFSAAEKDHGPSQNKVGVISEAGELVKKDDEFALTMYRLAAENGEDDAAENAARLSIKLSEHGGENLSAKPKPDGFWANLFRKS